MTPRDPAAVLANELAELRKWRERMEILARENDDLRAELGHYARSLAAALPVLEAVEAYVEKVEDPRVFVDWHLYRDMRDAFYAFRASMEAGGPAGWRVAEDPTPDKP